MTDKRLAILVEGPQGLARIRLLAQHSMAKGLEPNSVLPDETGRQFHRTPTMLPVERQMVDEEDERLEAKPPIVRMHRALDRLADVPGRSVLHLPSEDASASEQAAPA